MPKGGTFDRSKPLTLYARIGEIGVPVVLIFEDEDGNPVDISDLDFELPVSRRPYSDALFTLTIGDGLSIIGANNNKLKIEISEARSDQRDDSYFYKLKELTENHTWLTGAFYFHNGQFDGIMDDFQTVNDMDITITLGNGSSDTTEIHDWDETDSLPDDVGKGYWIKFTHECIVPYLLGVRTYPQDSVAFSLAANSGSAANWYAIPQG